MGIELNYLFMAVILTFVQMLVAAIAANQQVGLNTLAGNRDTMGELTGIAGRAKRAHRNMLESLPLFIALVLIVQITGKANGATAFGASLFFWARLVYAGVYVAGLPWLRTVVWFVSVVGMVIIALRLLGVNV